jgi:long-subunit acyl-CoA synthetase (AMP-forming)
MSTISTQFSSGASGAATLCEAFQATAAARAAQIAHRTHGGGLEFTYGEFAARVEALARGFHSLGVRRGDTVGLMLTNRPEFNLADTAAMHLGAIAFSVYNTSSPEQIADRRARGFDFESAWRAVQPEDVITLIYTSGTTGPPKAVQLTHGSVMHQCRAVDETLPAAPGGRCISYLPCAHVGDRVLNHYSASLCRATTVTSVADHRLVGAALPEVRPTFFGAVPRVWEKLRAALEASGIKDPAALPEAARAAVLARLGLDQVHACLSSAAPIPVEVLEYFRALGLPLQEAWGMSELSCFATLNPRDDIRVGTVGKALPGVELRLADDGELLVRSPLVMKGYRDDPERTAEAIDAEGWLHTGDIARIDADGYVTIVDRKKEIIINSAGKNMSPANIEQKLRASSPLIAYAVCIGDRRPYNTALLVLDPDAARGLDAEPLRSALDAAVATANEQLSRVEQVKRYEVVRADWQPGGDELTPTSKLKRRVIHDKYRDEIERLYR